MQIAEKQFLLVPHGPHVKHVAQSVSRPLRTFLGLHVGDLAQVTEYRDELQSQLNIAPYRSMKRSGKPVRAAQWQVIIDHHAQVRIDRDRVIAWIWLWRL